MIKDIDIASKRLEKERKNKEYQEEVEKVNNLIEDFNSISKKLNY
jgi:hypothetical protein